MTASHLVQSKSKTFKPINTVKKEKGAKIPIKILNTIRKKAITTLKQEKQQHRVEDIQYQSLAKTKDVKFLDKIKQMKSGGSKFMKNKYKFKDMKTKSIGQFKDGALNIRKKDLFKMKHNK